MTPDATKTVEELTREWFAKDRQAGLDAYTAAEFDRERVRLRDHYDPLIRRALGYPDQPKANSPLRARGV